MAQSERFDSYMERCLYGPDGFYATGGVAGRRGGDFLTSPEVGPLFGAVLFRAIDAHWEAAGRPDRFTVYDVGCGPGTLLRAVGLAAEEAGRSWDLVGVDRVGSAGATLSELPDDLSDAVVVANELLDNIPFRVVERVGDGLCEVFVSDGAEHLEPVDLGPGNGIDPNHPIAAIEPGQRAPLLEGAAAWVADTLARHPIRLMVFDYGTPTTVELAQRGGWLRTYQQHRRGNDPLVDPGQADITTDIAWDQMPEAGLLSPQADFLRRWGIDDLVAAGRQYWTDHAAAPDLRAIRMRSRIGEAEALLAEDGLGAFWSAEWGTEAAPVVQNSTS